jgi:7-cyano-7-deazaguanine synthase
MSKAVVLLSGGLDSTTCLALAKNQGFDCYPLSFAYDQKSMVELAAAKRVAAYYKVSHKVLTIPINEFLNSALTDPNIAVPDYTGNKEIPVTYVPARNTIFLSMALAYAEILNAQHIFIGISSVDYSGYPDCRPEYLDAFQKMANLATKRAVEGQALLLEAPLIYLSKAETIKLGVKLGVDYSLTVTCYQADEQGRACGRCDSCTYRKKGFSEADIPDPTLYY